ncbi:S24 family peptidase [Chitiniphilus shinanonensis]|uniref:S24 family peptidase n=1 Tax=Chitiniphilus shinanonensis TaxID=553088 RepID=UPI003066E6CC
MVNNKRKPRLLNGSLTYVTMNTLSQRLAVAIASLQERDPLGRYSQAWLARQVGVSSVAVNKWFNGGTTSLEGENLLKAARALRVRPEWLAAGRGPMEASELGPPIETPFRPVRVIDNIDEAEHEIFEVPRYTLRASAGSGELVFEVDEVGSPNFFRSAWAKREGLDKSKLFSIVAKGDSMEPKIPDGASVIVHRQNTIVNGKVHVICRDGECYVKRLIKQMDGSVLIRSDNRDNYKDVEVAADELDNLHVVGLVVSVAFNM